MAVNVVLVSDHKYNQFELLDWLNESLQTKFNNIEEICSGAAFCQLMDWLFPGSINLKRVKFQARTEVEFIHNYSLLQASFRHSGITKLFSEEELIKGNFEDTFMFLKWFKLLFEVNYHGQKYNASEARGGEIMLPAKSSPVSPQAEKPVTSAVNRGSKSDAETKESRRSLSFNFENWQEIFPWLQRSELGDTYGHCKLCTINLNVSHCGQKDLRRHELCQKHCQNAKRALQEQEHSSRVDESTEASFHSVNMLKFLEKHCCSQGLLKRQRGGGSVSHRTARTLLGLEYPKDIVKVCCQIPYCVYLYRGVELDKENNVSLVLVGFFDEQTERNCIRLLDVIQPPIDTDAAEFTCLVETLNKFGVSLLNFVNFYTNADSKFTQPFFSCLQKINPDMVSLYSLYDLADHACHLGVKELPGQVEELIMNIHQHCSTCPTTNDILKELFVNTQTFDSAQPISAQCLIFSNIIRKMLNVWPDLISYFESCSGKNDKAKQICAQLESPQLRLMFMFLSHALEPLCAFQDRLYCGGTASKADLAQILLDASDLLRLFAARFLRPEAMVKFLKSYDTSLLMNKTDHVAEAEMNMGAPAREFLAEHKEELNDTLANFAESAAAFYAVLTGSIAESLPLNDAILRSISLLLRPARKLNLTGKMVTDVGCQLGLCKTPEKASQLMNEFLDYQLLECDGGSSTDSEDPSLQQQCGRVLKTLGQTSILRKLILTLLALPWPPLEVEKLFVHVLGNVDSELVTSHVLDVTDDSAAFVDGGISSSAASSKRPNGVIDLTENEMEIPQEQQKTNLKSSERTCIDDDIIWTSTSYHEDKVKGSRGWEKSLRQKPQARQLFQAGVSPQEKPQTHDKNKSHKKTVASPVVKKNSNTSTPNKPPKMSYPYLDGKGFTTGELVWGQVEGFSLWPGLVIDWRSKQAPVAFRRVEWFGDGFYSEIHINGLQNFADFAKCFCEKSFASLDIYKTAIFQSLKLAAERCGKSFPSGPKEKREEQLKVLLDWAFGGFKPTGPEAFRPPPHADDEILNNLSPVLKKQDSVITKHGPAHTTQESTDMNQESTDRKQGFACMKKEAAHVGKESANQKQLSVNGKKECVHMEQDSLNRKQVSLNRKQDSPNRKQESLNRRQESINRRQESFNRRQEALNRKQDSPNRKQQSFNRKQESSNRKQDSPNQKQASPNRKQDSPNRKEESFNKKQESSNRKQESVNVREELAETSISEYQPPPKKLKQLCKSKYYGSVTLQERRFGREKMVQQVLTKGKSIEDFCLSCGTTEVKTVHPLFEGSLCLKCKDNFTETLYRYDEDGYQSYCTVCCAGLEVILCGDASCCRSYCVDCLNILVGKDTFDQLAEVDPWSCYLCLPSQRYGVLKSRLDWSIRVQDFFANNSVMEFEPHRVFPSIPANQRRPIKVLSLFDGIATGYLVLRDLGLKVDKYVASEICEDSTVGKMSHDDRIIHVNDARTITKKHIAEWGPFDFLIGGNPCNDPSVVNPARKGLYEGTGRLLFEYYRLLSILKPKENDDRPFFWLFENVVAMSHKDKEDICRFLECNPVLIDAVKVSPAHRARYFWGNLPGMNRPIIAALKDKPELQQSPGNGRKAKFSKVRTITKDSNSIKQGTTEMFPVTMNGKEDILWITEMEKVFGFPKHYSDVNNMNRAQRQKVLDRSRSVPVIRHLFAPLKDYFSCE